MTEVIGLATLEGVDGTIKSFFEPIAIERLEEVIDRMYFKGLKGEIVMRSHKDDGGQSRSANLFENGETAQFRHLDIEKNEVRLFLVDAFYGGNSVIALADEFDVRFRLKQRSNPFASERF